MANHAGCECVAAGRSCTSCNSTSCRNVHSRRKPANSITKYITPKKAAAPIPTFALPTLADCSQATAAEEPKSAPGTAAELLSQESDPARDTTAEEPSDDNMTTADSEKIRPDPPTVALGSPDTTPEGNDEGGRPADSETPPASDLANGETGPLAEARPDTPAVPDPVATVTETGADLPGYELTPGDRQLDAIYGDHCRSNPGDHLDGGVPGDSLWQSHWRRVVQISPSLYSVPNGAVARRFFTLLVNEWRTAREDRTSNSEKPLVFPVVILHKTLAVRRAKDIRALITQRLDL
jgi:hypothetical protein